MTAPAGKDGEGTPEVDAAVRMVVDETPFPLGHLAMEAYEAVPADIARDLSRRLALAEAQCEGMRRTLKSIAVDAEYGSVRDGLFKDILGKARAALSATREEER